MKQKIVYVCHPIGGDVKGNLEKLATIIREINLTHPNVVPVASYYADVIALDDTIEAERERGLSNDIALINTGAFDECWIYGDRISPGIIRETNEFEKLGTPLVPKSDAAFEYLNR